MTCGQTFSFLSSARTEERAESKARGQGMGDNAGCQRLICCCFVLCHRDKRMSSCSVFNSLKEHIFLIHK